MTIIATGFLRLLAVGVLGLLAACAPEPLSDRIAPAELAGRLEAGSAPLVLDVRTAEDFAAGHIPGALNIPLAELPDRVDELGADRSREIVVHCNSGRQAALAEQWLADAGFSALRDLEGHMNQWRADGRPIQPVAQ
jgi:rhodanese-related sulfurtransferase